MLVVTLLCCTLFANAQPAMQDVVYLTNGSIIRGIIIEQVPNKSLKIKTADGSIFVYDLVNVEKITKENIDRNQYGNNSSGYYDNNHYNNGGYYDEYYGNNAYGRQQRSNSPWHKTAFSRKGYRGFVDIGGAVGVGDYGDGVFAVSTSHGYQFNPYIFVGAGIGVDYHFDYETMFLPIFADLRGYFIDGRITPFVGIKIGYSPVDGTGLYFNPSVGASFGISRKLALNISIGYNLQRAEMYNIYYNYSYYTGYSYYYSDETIGAITFKVGFEF